MNVESRTARILLLEDSPLDAELIGAHLKRAGLLHRIQRVQSKAEFSAALAEPHDLIIADYVLPSFDGIAALDIAQALAPDIPFILVSGTLDEEAATDAMRKGATDFVTKQRLSRLPSAVRRAMAEAAERRARERAEAALRDSEEHYRMATQAARVGVWRHEITTNVLTLDAAALECFGFAEPPGTMDALIARIHPSDAGAFNQSLAAAADPQRKGPVDIEYRIMLPGGGTRWLSVFGAVYFSGEGEAERAEYGLGTVQDVTERKEAEEKIHFLMREVNHRSKNLLSVVQSIARQTAGQTTPGRFVERFSQRLQGLAASHDLLVKNAWQGVLLEELVREQLSHFRDLMGWRILLEGPDVRMNAAAAQSLGMALHELGTNAAKYGALANERGMIRLGWSIAEEAEPPVFTMEWSESGGPDVPEPAPPGLGTRIVTDLTARALQAEVDLRYGSSGVTWSLSAPLEMIRES